MRGLKNEESSQEIYQSFSIFQIRFVLTEKTREFENTLRSVIILLFILGILNVYTLKRITAAEIGVFVSIFSLWGVFEWIIKLNRALHRIENAKNLKEVASGFLSLFALLIQQEVANRIRNLLSRIWDLIRKHI